MSRTLPLHIHDAPQLAVPSSVSGELRRLLPLHLEVFVPTSVRAAVAFDCKFACIAAAAAADDAAAPAESASPAHTIVATVAAQPPAYLDLAALPTDALVVSAAARHLFMADSFAAAPAAPPQLRATFTPISSFALPLWDAVQLRVVPHHRLPASLRDMPAALHPLFPLDAAVTAAESGGAVVRPALSHVRRQLVDKPLFGRSSAARSHPVVLLCPDGHYRAVEALGGAVSLLYGADAERALSDPLYGWGVLGPHTRLSWCETLDDSGAAPPPSGVAAASSATAAAARPHRRPVDLSIDELFRRHLPSFEEGLAAAADEELKSVALLLKMFATAGQDADAGLPHGHGGVPPQQLQRPPPTLLQPRSILLSGPRGTGKQSFVHAVAALLGLAVHTLSFSRLILRKNVTGQAQALADELAAVRRRVAQSAAAQSGSAQSRRCVLLFPAMELTFASSDERDEDAMALQHELLSFLRTLASEPALARSVIVVGLTCSRALLAPVLAQAFQFRFQVAQPSDAGRLRILQAHLRLRVASGSSDGDGTAAESSPPRPVVPFDAALVNLQWVVEQTQGFVGADLVSLVKTAVAHASQRHRTGLRATGGGDGTAPLPTRVTLNNADFQHALSRVHPASLKALHVVARPQASLPPAPSADAGASSATAGAADGSEPAGASFDGVGGLHSVKAQLREALLWPFRHSASFRRLGIRAPKGVLLYGVPGVGKSLLSRTVAREFNLNFIVCRIPDLLQAGVGESEKRIEEVFARARRVAPAVIFLDEVQAVFSRGAGAGGAGGGNDMAAKLMAQLLFQIDRLNEEDDAADMEAAAATAATATAAAAALPSSQQKRVFILAATNLPSALDPSLLRSGRLDKVLYVGPPDGDARREILLLARGSAVWDAEVEARMGEIVARCDGFSGVDVVHLVGRAGLCALQRDPHATQGHCVRFVDFERALESVSSSITQDMIDTCVRWGYNFQRRHLKKKQEMLVDEQLKQFV